MPWGIPNDSTTAKSHVQSAVDTVDWQALAQAGFGTGVLVVSGTLGCAVSATVAALAVDITAGTVEVRWGAGALAAVSALALTTADATNPRLDLIVASVVAGVATASVLTGTAAAAPVFPTVATDSNDNWTRSLLAAVYVAPTVTSLVSTDIVDKRVSIHYSLSSERIFRRAMVR